MSRGSKKWTEEEIDLFHGPLHTIYGWNPMLRTDAIYHGLMTIVDLLFLPFILIVLLTGARTRYMLHEMRNGMTNAVRGAVLFAASLAFCDLLLLVPIVIIFSPLGWIGRRYRPLKRALCGGKNRNSTSVLLSEEVQEKDEQQAAETTPLKTTDKYKNYGDTVTNWHILVVQQIALVFLDILTLPFLLLVLSPVGFIGVRGFKFWKTIFCTWDGPPDTLMWHWAIFVNTVLTLLDLFILFPLLVVLSPLGLVGQRNGDVYSYMWRRAQGKHGAIDTNSSSARPRKETELIETVAAIKENNEIAMGVASTGEVKVEETSDTTGAGKEVPVDDQASVLVDPYSGKGLEMLFSNAFNDWYAFILGRFILVLVDLAFLPFLLLVLCNPARAWSIFVVVRFGPPNQNIWICEWYAFILRQAVLTLLDILLLPITLLLFVTRWRWIYLDGSKEEQQDINAGYSLCTFFSIFLFSLLFFLFTYHTIYLYYLYYMCNTTLLSLVSFLLQTRSKQE
jgi:hypothetical protein